MKKEMEKGVFVVSFTRLPNYFLNFSFRAWQDAVAYLFPQEEFLHSRACPSSNADRPELNIGFSQKFGDERHHIFCVSLPRDPQRIFENGRSVHSFFLAKESVVVFGISLIAIGTHRFISKGSFWRLRTTCTGGRNS